MPKSIAKDIDTNMGSGRFDGSGKDRLKWTEELHDLFEKAVNQLGGPDRATPRGILKTMGTPGLTVYHVKSHLQGDGSSTHGGDATIEILQAVRDGQNQMIAAMAALTEAITAALPVAPVVPPVIAQPPPAAAAANAAAAENPLQNPQNPPNRWTGPSYGQSKRGVLDAKLRRGSRRSTWRRRNCPSK
ncbi:hypothetical protein RHGRI_011144 [Rhododendron griersonianum]|uniref:HTH myb-type domain-containing protein n=1 Tax=Rhododendron griersonianum TaxID=479676 RepID=A0AAV6KLJ5_9ERIC|nr:hypothetical protein RHGRI_011144 [Rhododendron griersonianum]